MNDNFSLDTMAVIIEKNDGLYFIVTPPLAGGRPMPLETAKSLFRERDLMPPADEILSNLLKSPAGAEYKISETITTEFVSLDEELPPEEKIIYVEISHDQLNAYISFFPEDEPEEILVKKIMKALEDAGIRYGIKYGEMNEWIRKREPVESGLIAEGCPPEDGEDAKIKFHFNPDVRKSPEILEDGSVDHRLLNLIQGVKKNDCLCEITQATPGRPGVTVTGRYLTHKGGEDNVNIMAGKNIRLSEDKQKFYSTIDGHIIWQNNTIYVYPIFSVKGDVDYSVGNINYSGNVVINGYVKTGFKVYAEGDIEIFGGVEGAHVVSEKGSIWIHKGVQGIDSALLKAEKDVVAKFIERSQIIAFRDVIVDEDIIHSEVSSGRFIYLTRGTGQVIGGILRAQKKIHVNTAGAEKSTRTELRIEHIKTPEYREELNKLTEKILVTQRDLSRVKNHIVSFKKTLISKYENVYKRLKTTYNFLVNQFYLLRKRKRLLEKRLSTVHTGTIDVDDTAYPDVIIAIGPRHIRIEEKIKTARFSPDGPDIRIS